MVFAGFSFDGAAQAIIQEDPNPRVRIHIAHINPDVAMGDPLKKTPSTQLFTVFGLPRTQLEATADGEYTIKMEGVDIYNPVDNTVSSAGADKVAAWFVDTDYYESHSPPRQRSHDRAYFRRATVLKVTQLATNKCWDFA